MAAAYRADNEHNAWNTLYERCAILALFGACLYPTIETMAIDRIERGSASLCAHSGHHRAINVWSLRSLPIDTQEAINVTTWMLKNLAAFRASLHPLIHTLSPPASRSAIEKTVGFMRRPISATRHRVA